MEWDLDRVQHDIHEKGRGGGIRIPNRTAKPCPSLLQKGTRGLSILGILTLCGIIFLSGCTTSSSRTRADSSAAGSTLAVIPFESLVGNPHAGSILAELFQTEVYAQGGWNLVSPEKVTAALLPYEGKALEPAKLGELLGAEYLIVGRVTEYTYKGGVGEYPAIGLSLRLIHAPTGRIVWAEAQSRTGKRSFGRYETLSQLAQGMCRDLAISMRKARAP